MISDEMGVTIRAKVRELCNLRLSDPKNYEAYDAYFNSLRVNERRYALKYLAELSGFELKDSDESLPD
jgi:hypothetical protein